MGYATEFRSNWRPLLAAAVGLGGGVALQNYMTSLFAPALIAEFGWERSVFALIGLVGLLFMIAGPIAGRMTDKFGVRRIALIGIIAVPATFFALSFINTITEFFAITVVQILIGATTTAAVYSKVVAGRFTRARGLALSVAICGPALVAAIGTPFLERIIADHGWRVGYQALAAFSLLFGLLAYAMMSGRFSGHEAPVRTSRPASHDYKMITRTRAFWVMMIGMLLCNLAQSLPSSQMSLLLIENGLSTAQAAGLLSLFAIGVIVGRFACGLALDHFSAPIVASLGMGIPAIGLVIMASDLDTQFALAIAVLTMAVSQGAEGDLGAYLVARYFGMEVFSSVASLVTAMMAAGSALGTFVLSATLARTDSYDTFLIMGAVAIFLGSIMFLLLGRAPPLPVAQPQTA